MSSPSLPRILPYGDCALLVEFGNLVDREVSEKILALNEAIAISGLPGLTETVPTFRSLLVKYDPVVTRFRDLQEHIVRFLGADGTTIAAGKTWHIPVCYDGEYAPDLENVAERLGLKTSDVIDQHMGVDYHCYMVGFVAGCPYLGDMPETLALPRRTDPRTRVPDRSIAIAMRQTVIYPLVSPGGWHLIGKTPIKIFDLSWDEPALFTPGDKVQFKRITQKEFETWEAEMLHENRKLEPVEQA